MARYGRDYGRDRWTSGGGYGQGGYGGGGYGRGGGSSRGGGEYGGMGSDSSYGGGSQYNAGHTGYGTGGGAYDNDFNGGYGYGYGGTQDYGGYGADSGFSGGYGGGGQGDWSHGRDSQQRGGYGGGGGYGSGGGGGYGASSGSGYGGAGYTGGGQGYGGYGGGWSGGSGSDAGTGSSYGGSSYGGQQDETRRLRAADVMTDNPETVTPETTLAEAARKMRDLDVGIIPVVESDGSKRLRGVLTDRDIAIRAVADGKDANTTRVMEVMTTQVETCNKNDSLRDVLSVMEREQVRRVPITDREGRLVGIIAQADVATEVDTAQGQRHFANTVESISEPGNPRGVRWGGRASQGRGGGLMGAVRSAVSNLGGSSPDSSYGGTNTGGMNASGGTTGNDDPRAINDPGSENV